jgi:hypothetical protein
MALEFLLMRIISIRPQPVIRCFAIIYAGFGLFNFVVFSSGTVKTLTLPIGIELGLIHLSLYIHLPHSDDLLANAFQFGASIATFALTGVITAIALTLWFNFIAKQTGGIDAKFVTVANDEAATVHPLNTTTTVPLGASSSGDAPTTTAQDISAHNPRSLW